MRKMMILAGLLALPLAGAKAQAIPPNCSGVLELSGWQSKSERGYWASSVDLRNLSGQPVQVTVTFTGPGAMSRPAFRMEAGAWHRNWLARTAGRLSEAELRAGTVTICSAPG